MSARVLMSGVLHKPPVRRTSKNGNPYLIATVRDGNGPDAKWWTLFVFSESGIEVLEGLAEGEAIAASGTFEASIWAPEGKEPRVNLTISVDAILSAHKRPKAHEAKPKAEAAASRGQRTRPGGIGATSWAAPEPPLLAMTTGPAPRERGAPFDDEVPF